MKDIAIMSHCCGARINPDTCICGDCKDHANPIVVDENGEEIEGMTIKEAQDAIGAAFMAEMRRPNPRLRGRASGN